MQRWIRRLAVLACMLCVTTALAGAASKPVDIRDLMTVTQFDKAGLDKLSPGEIKALNAWLNQYLESRISTSNPGTPAVVVPNAAVAPATPAKPSHSAAAAGIANFGADTMTPKQPLQEPSRIESRIVGRFTGWTGNTVFKLENGQIWKQAATGYFTNVDLDNPEVVIKKLTFGYLLTLPGHGETVFVRRVK